jgi:hypothetical protein
MRKGRRISGRIVEKRRIGLGQCTPRRILNGSTVERCDTKATCSVLASPWRSHPSKRLLDYGQVGYPFIAVPNMATFVPESVFDRRLALRRR